MPEPRTLRGVEFKTNDINNWIEAVVHILSGFTFLFTYYKKATLATVILATLMIWQYLSDYQQIQNFIGLFGG